MASKVPAVPSLQNIKDPETRRVLQALIDGWNVRNGQTRDDGARFVTRDELKEISGGTTIFAGSRGGAQGGAGSEAGGSFGVPLRGRVQEIIDQITNSLLWKRLTARIDKLDGPGGALEKIGLMQTGVAEYVSQTDSKIEVIEGQLVNLDGNIAAVVDTKIAEVTPSFATAQSVTDLQTTVNGVSANAQDALQIAQSVDGSIDASWTVKFDVDGYVVGAGLGLEGKDGAYTSQFLVRADRFAVGSPTAPDLFPFIVDSSSGSPLIALNGQVYIGALTADEVADRASEPPFVNLGDFATAPSTTGRLRNSIYRNTTDGNTYILKTDGGSWSLWIQKGPQGPQGPQGSQGPQGLTGERGSLTGYGSKYSIVSSSWSDNQAQAVIYNMIYGTSMTSYASTGHLRIGDTVTLSNGSTFAQTRYWGGASWLTPGVVIDGNLLVSGTVSASKVGAGTMDANGITINSTYGSIGFGSASYGGIVANFLASSANQYGVFVSSGKLGVTNGYYLGGSGTIMGGLAGKADQDSGMSNEKSAVGLQAKGVSSHGFRGRNSTGTASGVVGSNASYDFYAEGSAANYGPFTGAHDALIHKDLPVQLGDIVCDVQRVTQNGWSNVLFEVAYSDAANQPAVGVLIHAGPLLSASCCLSSFNTPVIAIDDFGNEVRENQADYDAFKDTHKTAIVNALGEGQINVCGEGGNIENGDLIVTSSMSGKGMKQADNIVRSYTVAKARETVSFSSPTEVKQVACIYLCG